MARIPLTPVAVIDMEPVSIAIADLTTGTVDGWEWENDGYTWLVIHNSGIAANDITILTTATTSGWDYSPEVKSIAAGFHGEIGPFNPTISGSLTKVDLDANFVEMSAGVLRHRKNF